MNSTKATAMMSKLGFVAAALALVACIAHAPAKADDASAKLAQGKELFQDYACGTCHTLADAGAYGEVGPSLDGDPNLSEGLVISRVTNGQGAMPPFGDQMNDDEIADLAAYVMQAAEK